MRHLHFIHYSDETRREVNRLIHVVNMDTGLGNVQESQRHTKELLVELDALREQNEVAVKTIKELVKGLKEKDG